MQVLSCVMLCGSRRVFEEHLFAETKLWRLMDQRPCPYLMVLR